MNYKEIITSIYNELKIGQNEGAVASYIPELAKVNSDNLGIHITTIQQKEFGIGDYTLPFSIQSIAKVLALTLAYQELGVVLWNRVGVEPSGTPFNSLTQLEADKGIPRNPFINAGAMVVCDVLLSNLEKPKEDFLVFVRNLAGNPNIKYSTKIALSEKQTGFRNVALCNFIKSFGNIKNEPEAVLDFYFHLCSIEMTCQELSKTMLFLANGGTNPLNQQVILNSSRTKRINALMQTCGFYDESGEFAFKVGLPGKSGVGGGIIAIHPGQYSIVVWSPKLNPKGNSFRGMRFLEAFTTRTEQSIF